MKIPIKNIELWLAAVVCLGITLLYVGAIPFFGIPPASGLVGHSMGIFGFVLMLATEVLYSLRKRYQGARYGKMSTWLSFHIFTGLVGPFLVLLHSSWKFSGLAGVVMLFTIIIVLSGFVGRYFYTAVPRSADGAVLELATLEKMGAAIQNELVEKAEAQPELAGIVQSLLSAGPQSGTPNEKDFQKQAQHLRGLWRRAENQVPVGLRSEWRRLRALGERQITIQQQLASLSTARRMLAIWHTLHVPLGMVLFLLAFIHIIGALYYATFLH